MASRPRKRRVRHDIIIEILQNAKGGAKKTNIMYKVNLSFIQLELYLDNLAKAGLISEKSGIWKTTEKGLHVIDACNICHSLMEEVM